MERFNRTLQTEWSYRQVFASNDARTQALAPWLEFLQHSTPSQRTQGTTPHQPTATNLLTEYSQLYRMVTGMLSLCWAPDFW
ncbi:hypothetical protein FHT40_006342 [Mycolicibacterium sp. BK556]|nr:hypothetical protein [Mycolicibacterium sp. BK556]MBB3753730.1 hypothetical protein [Mycolicibacterium sp. BK634]